MIYSKQLWQSFESVAGKIFEANDFSVEVNKVKVENRKRRQFDVIAKRGNLTIAVDCKRWDKDRYKTSALKDAVEKHIERTKFLSSGALPLIVTLYDEAIYFHDDVPIVPIQKLNTFILENW